MPCAECLRFYSRYPQTLRIFFGGGHDNGYLPTLTALQNEHLLRKIILLKGYNDTAKELNALNLPVLSLENIFRPIKLPQSPALATIKPIMLGENNALQVTTVPLYAPPGLTRQSINSPRSEITNSASTKSPSPLGQHPPFSNQAQSLRSPTTVKKMIDTRVVRIIV